MEETKTTTTMMTCHSCGKQGEVAFKVNARKPDKISRASQDTPRPLCLICAEKRRDELLASLRDQPKESEPNEKESKETDSKPAEERHRATRPRREKSVQPGDVRLNWRWDAYGGGIWTQRKPTLVGDYWIWSEKDYSSPVLRKINPAQANSTMQQFLENADVWYLGPCAIPKTPKQASEQALNNKALDSSANPGPGVEEPA